MKSSRLIRMLLLLQLHGQMSAARLAEELEVSVRTVYRDAEALMMAGVPLYSTSGPAGGYHLVEGWQTRLTGLTTEEAEALFLTGLPGPAAELGLGTVVAVAGLKIETALPPELRGRTARIRERFHLDAPGWFTGQDPAPFLAEVADAVWNQHRLAVRYTSWSGELQRVIDPLGIVLKGGFWYLVARAGVNVRTYRVSRILELSTLEEGFERPPDFDLASFWAANAEGYESEMFPVTACVKISSKGLRQLSIRRGANLGYLVGGSGAPAPRGSDRIEVRLPVEQDLQQAARDLLGLGSEVEVVTPTELRTALQEELDALHHVYGAT